MSALDGVLFGTIFPSSECAVHYCFVSHFNNSHNISDFFVAILSVVMNSIDL